MKTKDCPLVDCVKPGVYDGWHNPTGLERHLCCRAKGMQSTLKSTSCMHVRLLTIRRLSLLSVLLCIQCRIPLHRLLQQGLYPLSARMQILGEILGTPFVLVDSIVSTEKLNASKQLEDVQIRAFDENVIVLVPDGSLGEIHTVMPFAAPGC